MNKINFDAIVTIGLIGVLAIRVLLYCVAIWFLFHGRWIDAIALTVISEFILWVLTLP